MSESQELATFNVAGQTFAIPIGRVQDAFVPRAITAVPKAPRQVAGVLNLRGRIVTAVSLRECLGLPAAAAPLSPIAVGIEHRGELYGLIVDEMGEVLMPNSACREENPVNLDAKWRFVSACVYRLRHKLVLVLDVDRLLDFRSPNAA